jgi:hypothetical protein
MRRAHLLIPGLFLLGACVVGEADVTSVDAIAAGKEHSCATTSEGRLFCWGANVSEQLGSPDASPVPRAVFTGPLAVAGVDGGVAATCGVLTGSGAICWGGGSSAAQRIRPDLRFREVSVGGYACGVTTAGAVHCWTPPDTVTQAVAGVDGATEVAVDGNRGCATVPDTGILCWGAIGTAATPVLGTVGVTFHELTLGGTHGCAIDPDGIAKCWGGNTDGQLGNGNFGFAALPTAVIWGDRPSVNDLFVELSAGEDLTCGVTQSHGGFCWGQGVAYPKVIPQIHSWVTVRAGNDHACGVARGDEPAAYCWGANQYGQLGTGDTLSHSAPAAVRLP